MLKIENDPNINNTQNNKLKKILGSEENKPNTNELHLDVDLISSSQKRKSINMIQKVLDPQYT